jgi:hypothetical protein
VVSSPFEREGEKLAGLQSDTRYRAKGSIALFPRKIDWIDYRDLWLSWMDGIILMTSYSFVCLHLLGRRTFIVVPGGRLA